MNKVIYFFYTVFLLLLVCFSYLFIDPGFFYLRFLFTNFYQLQRTITTVGFIVGIILFFAFYLLFLYRIKRNQLSKKTVFCLVAITVGVLLLAYPAMLSFDIFNYIATAKVTFFYNENPYLIMPIAFTHDPLLLFMHAANKTALYAFVWIALTGIPYLLGFGNFLLILLNFKIIVALFYIATIWLLWKMTKNIFQTMFFALNPLVIIETLISGHNDIVMMFLLLVSFYFLFAKRVGWSIFFYLASIGIKYTTVILLPLFIWQQLKPLSKEKFYIVAALFLYIIFFLSSLREEIYPWYALWFLLPVSLQAKNNLLTWISIAFSFSLLLRYIAFMLLGTYFGPTPFIKILLMIIPVLLTLVVYVYKKKVLLKTI